MNQTKSEVTYVHMGNSEHVVYQCDALIDIGDREPGFHDEVYKSCCTKRFTAEDPLDDLLQSACHFFERLLTRTTVVGSGLERLVPDIVLFGYLVVSGALLWLIGCLYFAAFLAGGIAVSLVRIGLKSLTAMVYIGLRPVLVACFMATLSRQSSVACVAAWLEQALYMVSWMVLLNGEALIVMAEFNLPLKLIAGLLLALAMIVMAHAISHMNLSPLSKYMAPNSISGFSLGVAYLASTTIEVCSDFKPPR